MATPLRKYLIVTEGFNFGFGYPTLYYVPVISLPKASKEITGKSTVLHGVIGYNR
ncbi:MAG TPA: hypothetical protein VK154_00815 [Chitinophagales bacterium]|nr:hypothetical protein [Chitinophagales bacterium]